MTANLRRLAPGPQDPTRGVSDQVDAIRDAIAARAERMDAHFPRAIDLEARRLAAMRPHLLGVASILAGVQHPEHFREMLRGERSFPHLEQSRLALSDRPEAARAVEADLEVLAEARGLALVPRRPRWLAPLEVAAQCAVVSPHAAAAILGALVNDGRIDDAERVALRPHAGAIRALAEAVDGLVEEPAR